MGWYDSGGFEVKPGERIGRERKFVIRMWMHEPLGWALVTVTETDLRKVRRDINRVLKEVDDAKKR